MFSCKFCKNFKTTHVTKHLKVTAFERNNKILTSDCNIKLQKNNFLILFHIEILNVSLHESINVLNQSYGKFSISIFVRESETAGNDATV